MKVQVTYFDEKRVYCKTNKEYGFVLLFKKPLGANDSDCESYYKDICEIISQKGVTFFASDLGRFMDWEDGIKEVISETLYILPFNENLSPTIGPGIIQTQSRSFVEISLRGPDRIIAKINVKRRNTVLRRYMLLALMSLILIVGVLLLMKILDNNRMTNNKIAYNEDITMIKELKVKWNEVCNPHNSFSKYIPDKYRNVINQSLNSLQETADNGFKAVSSKGKYERIDDDISDIERLINDHIEEAKLNYSKEEERGRINSNDSLYRHDIEMIQFWRNRLSHVVSLYHSRGQNVRIKYIQQFLDSMNAVANDHFNRVKESGGYVQVQLDSTKMESQIQRLIPKTTSNSKPHNKYNTNKTSGNTPHSYDRFNQLVSAADANFQTYYRNKKDKAAARKAIQGYSEALRIKYNANVSKRLRMLQNDL